MKKVIIFGTGKIADVVYYYAKYECKLEIEAFTIDKKYISGNEFNSLPIVPFEEIEHKYPPSEYDMFIALGYQNLNKLREKKCKEAKDKGYSLVSIISPLANLPLNVQHGENCFIASPSLIHPHVKLGNNVFVFSGAMIGHHSIIDDNCWFTSSANISGAVKVGKNCFFAVNSTVGNQVKIGDNCFIGANSLVTKCMKDEQVVIEKSTEVFRLNSKDFLRFSNFNSL